jgi:hypothetical protein
MAVLILVAMTACATSEKTLPPTEDAAAATQTALLALEQSIDDLTIPTATETTLDDMVDVLSDAESEIVDLPRTDAVSHALAAVRAASDAVAGALFAFQAGTDLADATAAVEAAASGLDIAIAELKASE